MEIGDYLKDELKRLNRMNDLLEKQINQEKIRDNQNMKIVKNVLTMCEIVKTMYL